MPKCGADDRVFARMAIEMNLGPRMPEQMRVHLQPGVSADGTAELVSECAAGLDLGFVPPGKQFALTGPGQMNDVPIAILVDQGGGLVRKRYIDDPTVLRLMFLEYEVQA